MLHILLIGLFHFPLLLDPYFPAFLLPSNPYAYHQLSHVKNVFYLLAFVVKCGHTEFFLGTANEGLQTGLIYFSKVLQYAVNIYKRQYNMGTCISHN